jgi:hypothetical protein
MCLCVDRALFVNTVFFFVRRQHSSRLNKIFNLKLIIKITNPTFFSPFSYGTTDHVEPCPPLYWGFLITYNQTHGRTPLDKWSARRSGLYLHRTTQHINTRENIHALSWIRTRDPSNQAAADHDPSMHVTTVVGIITYYFKCNPATVCMWHNFRLETYILRQSLKVNSMCDTQER